MTLSDEFIQNKEVRYLVTGKPHVLAILNEIVHASRISTTRDYELLFENWSNQHFDCLCVSELFPRELIAVAINKKKYGDTQRMKHTIISDHRVVTYSNGMYATDYFNTFDNTGIVLVGTEPYQYDPERISRGVINA